MMKKWVCNVCGYIHEGEQPPDVCPVCGVGPEEFRLLEDKPEKPTSAKSAKRWKCTVCDYIHVGDAPPDVCPLCGVGKEYFVLLSDEIASLTRESLANSNAATIRSALDTISYGLYIVSSISDNKINGQCANTVAQLTIEPCRIAVCLNKRNLTHEYVMASGVLAISVLREDQIDMVRHFGFQSGRTKDKFTEIPYLTGRLGCPILQDCVAYIEAKVLPDKTVDVGTHTLFVADVVAGQVASKLAPLTYRFYQEQKNKAK